MMMSGPELIRSVTMQWMQAKCIKLLCTLEIGESAVLANDAWRWRLSLRACLIFPNHWILITYETLERSSSTLNTRARKTLLPGSRRRPVSRLPPAPHSPPHHLAARAHEHHIGHVPAGVLTSRCPAGSAWCAPARLPPPSSPPSSR